ncbi:MAG: polysaccharide lyase family 7 protein [Verrucomicrobiae bacterium]|nr:polysaccharide lyase family 7 protein [Verrucomicrobiae bacterium]
MKQVVSQLCAGMVIILVLGFAHHVSGAGTIPGAGLTDGWKPMPFTHEIQHPFDLKTGDRYDFDPTNDIHHFWVRFTDKPHAPPPNKTNARSEMKLETYRDGEFMFDGDVMISPGTYACIGQVFDAAHGPEAMVVAHPDGTVTVQVHDLPKVNDVVSTNAIGHWWNLKMQNDTRAGGQVKIYVDNVLVATYPGRGPRDYYFKCGVYSREGSDLSEVRYRNIKMWVKAKP